MNKKEKPTRMKDKMLSFKEDAPRTRMRNERGEEVAKTSRARRKKKKMPGVLSGKIALQSDSTRPPTKTTKATPHRERERNNASKKGEEKELKTQEDSSSGAP